MEKVKYFNKNRKRKNRPNSSNSYSSTQYSIGSKEKFWMKTKPHNFTVVTTVEINLNKMFLIFIEKHFLETTFPAINRIPILILKCIIVALINIHRVFNVIK